MVHALNNDDIEQSEGLLSPVYIKDSYLLLEYWAARTGEARATMTRALGNDNKEQSEGLLSPTYIKDPLLLLEYWAARTAEARARVEEHLALARLNINMDNALKESGEALRRLEAALEYSPKAIDSLLNGPLF